MHFQQIGTTRLECRWFGPQPDEAPTIVFLHEGLGSVSLWRDFPDALAEATGLRHDRIIISAKVSGVRDLVDVYRLLAARCDYPLHLGLTEAGMGDKGIIASTAGLAILPRSGHAINLEEPALFNQLLEDFLHQVEAGRWGPRDPRATVPSIYGPSGKP